MLTQSAGLFLVIHTAAVTVTVCGSSFQKEVAFSELVADIVLGEEVRKSGRTLIIDRPSFDKLSMATQREFVKRLDKSFPGWIFEDVIGNFERLPGEWEHQDKLGVVNTTHLFITFSIENGGDERRLRYMRSYCGICGKGEEMKLRWNGDEWVSEVVRVIRL